jgi:hypothetical protein
LRLVCDEGVERPIVERLKEDGHDVLYIAELSPGVSDDEVLAHANRLTAPLVASDKDFGELVFRQNRATSGVVLVRLAGFSNEAKARSVSTVLQKHSAAILGSFVVISPGRVRIRRKKT